MSDTTKIKLGWLGEGRVGQILGSPIWVEQWWVPVKWHDEDDPAFCKAAGLEGFEDLIARKVEALDKTEPRRDMIAAHVAGSLAKIFGGSEMKALAESVAESAVLVADAVVAELQKGER